MHKMVHIVQQFKYNTMQHKKDSELEILFLWFPDTCK